MYGEVAAAAMIGISFSNSWVCLLLTLGTRTHSKRMAAAFIVGRFLGIMALGALMAMFGFFVDIPTNYYTLIFGVITILFALYIFARHILPKLSVAQRFTILKRLRILGCTDCSHHLEPQRDHTSCESAKKPLGCDGCPNRHRHEKDGSKKRSSEVTGKGGLFYGALRGATPCLKMLILAPLLITVSFPLAILITGVFALSSSIYPLIGFLAGGLITNLASVTRSSKAPVVLNLISLSMLLGIGIYYIYKFFTSDCGLEGV